MAAADQTPESGEPLCLGFVNTWGDRCVSAREPLAAYGDLVAWARAAGVLDEPEVRRLCAAAADAPAQAAAVLAQARALRAALYRIFSAVARHTTVPGPDVELLDRTVGRTLPWLRLRPHGVSCRWEWSVPAGALDPMLGPVAHSAAELLTGPEVGRVGECASPTCSWLFLDRSRNRRRRWCAMASCGNRAKARRHYRRQRQETSRR